MEALRRGKGGELCACERGCHGKHALRKSLADTRHFSRFCSRLFWCCVFAQHNNEIGDEGVDALSEVIVSGLIPKLKKIYLVRAWRECDGEDG